MAGKLVLAIVMALCLIALAESADRDWLKSYKGLFSLDLKRPEETRDILKDLVANKPQDFEDRYKKAQYWLSFSEVTAAKCRKNLREMVNQEREIEVVGRRSISMSNYFEHYSKQQSDLCAKEIWNAEA